MFLKQKVDAVKKIDMGTMPVLGDLLKEIAFTGKAIYTSDDPKKCFEEILEKCSVENLQNAIKDFGTSNDETVRTLKNKINCCFFAVRFVLGHKSRISKLTTSLIPSLMQPLDYAISILSGSRKGFETVISSAFKVPGGQELFSRGSGSFPEKLKTWWCFRVPEAQELFS